MPAERNRRHILVPGAPSTEVYSPHPRKIEPVAVPAPASRPAHGTGLRDALAAAVTESVERRQRDIPQVHNAVPGMYVQFESQPGIRLQLSSLEDRRQGIELAAVTYVTADEPDAPLVERATVFVPDGKVRHFLDRFERYSSPEPKAKGARRHESMLDPIATLRLATLRGLWTDTQEAYPAAAETIWWEMWLRRWDDRELERLLDFASQAGIRVSDRRLQFDDRIVALVEATATQLAASVDVLSDLAELRRAKQSTSPFVDTSPVEQAEWAEELASEPPLPHQMYQRYAYSTQESLAVICCCRAPSRRMTVTPVSQPGARTMTTATGLKWLDSRSTGISRRFSRVTHRSRFVIAWSR